jgi:Fe-S cluster assembly ATPase SufC
MRSPVHDAPVHFRANAGLIAAAQAKAEREGMSLSELMRAALRREVRGHRLKEAEAA